MTDSFCQTSTHTHYSTQICQIVHEASTQRPTRYYLKKYFLVLYQISSHINFIRRTHSINEEKMQKPPTEHGTLPRHTHTLLPAEAGVGLEEIMERLGHTDDDVPRRVYLHVTKNMKKEAAHKFDKLMDSLQFFMRICGNKMVTFADFSGGQP